MAGSRKDKDVRKEELVHAAFEVAKAEGLEHVTGRKVAAKAGLSAGLVFFYFQDRDGVLEAVLDRLIERLFGRISGAAQSDDLIGFLEKRIEHLRHERREVELFVDFWVMGVRQPAIRKRIKGALQQYRAMVTPLVPGTRTSEGLGQVAVSFILGCALQAVVDPTNFDTDTYLTTVRGLLATPGAKS
jgi:AcrR family transcriptional regulator